MPLPVPFFVSFQFNGLKGKKLPRQCPKSAKVYADKALKIKSAYCCTYRQISDVNISSVYYLSSFFKSFDHKTWHIGIENVSNGSSKDLLLCLRILTRKKTCSYVTLALKEQYEYGHLGCWYIKSTLYKRLLIWNKIFKKTAK